MSEDTKVAESWPEEREWVHGDAEWTKKAKVRDKEARSIKDRGACPFIPSANYLLMRISTVDFFLDSGFIIPNEDDPSGSGLHSPLMTIVACGPDVENYEPGDLVLTHPRNPELQVAWRDPRNAGKESAFYFMKDHLVLAHYDAEVVEQMKRRGRFLYKQQQERKAEADAQKRVEESPMNPFPKKEVLDGTGQPISKTGMHDE